MNRSQVTTIFYKSLWSLLDWIYPPYCAVCGAPGMILCSDCQGNINFITGKVCDLCGTSINEHLDLCQTCRRQPPSYHAMRNLAYYEGVIRECVHGLKYENNRSLGQIFSEWLVLLVKKEAWQIDAVIPVPLSRVRLMERGYNQAAVIAHPLALLLKTTYLPDGLERIRDTRSQVGLTAAERHQNVIGAFAGVPELVQKKNILLVDDVMTTGATMESCTKALKTAGAEKVFCVTIARFRRSKNLS